MDSTKVKNQKVKTYVWSGIAAFAYMVMFICWLFGAELDKLNILVLFIGAILGNLCLAVGEYKKNLNCSDEDDNSTTNIY